MTSVYEMRYINKVDLTCLDLYNRTMGQFTPDLHFNIQDRHESNIASKQPFSLHRTSQNQSYFALNVFFFYHLQTGPSNQTANVQGEDAASVQGEDAASLRCHQEKNAGRMP